MRLPTILFLFLCVATPFIAAANALPQADGIVIKKSERTLLLMKDGKVLRTYKVSLGPHPIGPKIKNGDGKTPEGHYRIDYRNAASHYHLALHVSYPNKTDMARARRLHVKPGGDIMIHGLPNGYESVGKAHLLHDWTVGCIAVTDEEIDEIWKMVPDGTPVDITP